METIDIQNRSFVVRWVKCGRGDVINYQVKPLKKSIELGIYKKPKTTVEDHTTSVHIAPNTRAVLDFASRALQRRSNSFSGNIDDNSSSSSSLSIGNIQKQSQEGTIRARLEASGFTLVKWIGHVDGNKLLEDILQVTDNDYYYGFVLDNTSSKNVKKKVLFNASVIDDDTKSMISTRSAPSPTFGAFGSTPQRDAPLVVGKGRYLQGYLLKKRRKKLQGFKRRFFTLDFKYGTLSYFMNDHNQTRRGEIVINLSTVSANKKDRLIIIDSGMEIWALKSRDISSWKIWVDALQNCFDNEDTVVSTDDNDISEIEDIENDENNIDDFRSAFSHEQKSIGATLKGNSYTLLPNEAYADFDSNLKLIQQRLEQCKDDSLLYKPHSQQSNNSPYKKHRSSSSSSIFVYSKIKLMSPTSPRNSTDSLLSPALDDFETKDASKEHELYQKLSDLESLFQQFMKQSKILADDHARLSKLIKCKTAPSLKSAFSDNEEFFDAEDEINRGVIILDDCLLDNNINDRLDTVTSGEKSPFDTNGSELPHILKRFNTEDIPPLLSITEHENEESTLSSKELVDDLYPLPYDETIKRRNDVKATNTYPQSLLSFLRKNVGKDLSSIAMPVTSNEPLTILQVISESFEYAPLLSQLNSHPEPIVLVSAFATSFLSIYRDKTRAIRKPFNPLLGETFELVREDMGFRLIAEKVSHKPQIFAFHADSADWECNYTVTPVQKFWGKSVELNNEGTLVLTIKSTGETFEWCQPTIMLKNLIAGERYLEPANEFDIISSKSGKVTISFEKTGMFGGRSEGIVGLLTPPNGKKQMKVLEGKWVSELKDCKTNKSIWKCGELVKNSKSKYGYTKFTSNLNEITNLEKDHLPPTDSRLRPDVRAYENGNIEDAEKLKLKLEMQQRERRQNNNDVRPRYFVKSISTDTWKFKKGKNSYWERRRRNDWSNVTPFW